MRNLMLFAALFLLFPAFAGDPAKPFSLAGSWTGGGFVIVMQEGGGGTIQDSPQSPAEPMRWKAAAGKLTLTQDGESVAYDYRVQGGALKLSGGDLDQPVSLSRDTAPAKAAAGSAAPPPAAKPAPAPKTAAPKPGDCAHACLHYLVCSAQASYENQAQCVAECRTVGYEAPFLGWFESTDCATAIAVINYLDSQKRGMDSGNGGGSSSSECNGCVRDGGECNWYSTGNWGSSGAYSGAVITCDQSCCR